MTAAAPRAAMVGVTKRFGSLVANRDVEFVVRRGEVHALLGENGAGKSTLMNMLFGLYPPDTGHIELVGARAELTSPRDALRRGVGMVHQHFMLVPDFTVAENIVLGGSRGGRLGVRRSGVNAVVKELLDKHQIDLDATTPARLLSVDQQQQVEILKLLHRGTDLLILDEPTAVLGPNEIDRLFGTLRRLCQAGASAVIITHKLSEVLDVADRVTVLRRGEVAASALRQDLDERSLSLAMLGRELPHPPARSGHAGDSAGARREPLLSVRGLGLEATRGVAALDNIDLVVAGGEILGIVGVEGNGQTELMRVLCGLQQPFAGTVAVHGAPVPHLDPRSLRELGVAVITDDRHRWDVSLDLSVEENLALVDLPAGQFTRLGMVSRSALRRWAARLIADYDITPADPRARLGRLSGGNQQKVVLARELSWNPKIVLASHPTRGLDLGASDFVLRKLVDIANTGGAVVVNSGDIDELFALADRIVVLYRGQVALCGRVSDLAIEDVAEAMTRGPRSVAGAGA